MGRDRALETVVHRLEFSICAAFGIGSVAQHIIGHRHTFSCACVQSPGSAGKGLPDSMLVATQDQTESNR